VSAPKKTDLELAEKHKYRLPNGDIAVSVTAISGFIDDGKSIGMSYGAAKLTREGLNFKEQWDAKRDAGTRVHGHLESFVRGEDIEQHDDDQGFVDALEKWMIHDNPKVLEQEFIALSNHGYGGRGDLICEVEEQAEHAGGTWLIDLKTGRKNAIEHTLQLAGYRYADGIAIYGPDGNLHSLRDLPPIDHAGCLYVASDGSYSLPEYPADEGAFRAFLALLDAYQWTRTDAMKAEVKASKVGL
jgi:hypothetical protein